MSTDNRPVPSLTGGEREMLRGFLDFHRATLAMKCEGLTDQQLRERSSPPSTLSLLGLVRHMAEVERTWFRRVIDGEDVPLVWSEDGDYQGYDRDISTRFVAPLPGSAKSSMDLGGRDAPPLFLHHPQSPRAPTGG